LLTRKGCDFKKILRALYENGLNPYWYLKYLFGKLTIVETKEDMIKLLQSEIEPKEMQMA